MRILALDPYFGGSHQAFLTGWSSHSRHTWTLLTLPAFKWKWRMRHAAITFADQVAGLLADGQCFDRLFCSDMLNLAEFRGLAPPPVRDLPAIVYFHENQLTYPVRHADERDYHFVVTNLTTALAATAVWFNSAFHRDSFLDGLPTFLRQMADFQPFEAIEQIRAKSSVHSPGIEPFTYEDRVNLLMGSQYQVNSLMDAQDRVNLLMDSSGEDTEEQQQVASVLGEPAPTSSGSVTLLPPRGPRQPGSMHILWAARWEHDKNPEALFDALRQLDERGLAFRLSLIGEQFRDVPPIFQMIRERFADRIVRWGYQKSRADYVAALNDADVFVSTAVHEFFGLSAVEAIAAGAYPLLPRRLAYPEILDRLAGPCADVFLYEGDTTSLANRLAELAGKLERSDLWSNLPDLAAAAHYHFAWPHHTPRLDQAIETTLIDGTKNIAASGD